MGIVSSPLLVTEENTSDLISPSPADSEGPDDDDDGSDHAREVSKSVQHLTTVQGVEFTYNFKSIQG